MKLRIVYYRFGNGKQFTGPKTCKQGGQCLKAFLVIQTICIESGIQPFSSYSNLTKKVFFPNKTRFSRQE